MAFHELDGRRIVEVYDEREKLIAAIYPAESGFKFVTKYPLEITTDDAPPSATVVRINATGA